MQSSTCTKIVIAFICIPRNLWLRQNRNRRVRVYTTRHPCLVKFNMSSSEQLWMTAVYYQIEDRSSVRDQMLIIKTDVFKTCRFVESDEIFERSTRREPILTLNSNDFSQNIEYHLRIVWLRLNRVCNDEKHFMYTMTCQPISFGQQMLGTGNCYFIHCRRWILCSDGHRKLNYSPRE